MLHRPADDRRHHHATRRGGFSICRPRTVLRMMSRRGEHQERHGGDGPGRAPPVRGEAARLQEGLVAAGQGPASAKRAAGEHEFNASGDMLTPRYATDTAAGCIRPPRRRRLRRMRRASTSSIRKVNGAPPPMHGSPHAQPAEPPERPLVRGILAADSARRRAAGTRARSMSLASPTSQRTARPRRARPGHAVPLVIAGAIGACALGLVTYLLWPSWHQEKAGDPSRLPVSIGNTLFNVPTKAVRVKLQKRSGPQERRPRLRLALARAARRAAPRHRRNGRPIAAHRPHLPVDRGPSRRAVARRAGAHHLSALSRSRRD